MLPLDDGRFFYFTSEKVRNNSRAQNEQILRSRRAPTAEELECLNALLEGAMVHASYALYRVPRFEAAAVVALSMVLHSVSKREHNHQVALWISIVYVASIP